MSSDALRTARKVWKQIKYNFEDRRVLELGSADDDAEQIKEIDADQIKDIEKAINDAIRTPNGDGILACRPSRSCSRCASSSTSMKLPTALPLMSWIGTL
jgi:hypothetical protein